MDYFTEKEKQCPCCGLNLVDRNHDFLRALNTSRDLYGRVMEATSMTRCEQHNAEIGGAPRSAHLEGRAVDIRCTDPEDRINMVKCMIAAGFRRIECSGVHVHADMKKGARDVLLIKTERGLV